MLRALGEARVAAYLDDQIGRIARILLETPRLGRTEGFAEVALLKRRGNLLIANAEKASRLDEVWAEEKDADGAAPLTRLNAEQALETGPIETCA